LEKVRLEIRKLKKNIKAINSDANNRLVGRGEASLGFVWSSEVVYNQVENPKVKMVVPKEGLIIFQDNMLILRDAPHKANAEKFINYILEPEVSLEITRLVPYATPNKAAYTLLDPAVLNNPSIYLPRQEIQRAEQINNDVNEKIEAIYQSIWQEFIAQ
jgi:spermidine/putrescine transport system permease protein